MSKSGLLGITILSLIFGGCTTGQKSAGRTLDDAGFPVVLETGGDLQFNDIPIPQGFALLVKESYSHEAQTFRIAHLRYIGKVSMEDSLAFFKEQMPVSNWKMNSVMGFGDSKTIDFEKEAEKCSVTVGHVGSDTFITIRLR